MADDGYDPAAVRWVYEDMAADYKVRFGSELADADPRDPDLEFLTAASDSFPGGPVLDLGCGPAQISRYLIGHGCRAIGLDFAPAMLAAAAELVPQASLICADLLELPLRKASCAAVVASYSLHHLPKARLTTALGQLHVILRPRGVLVVITHGRKAGAAGEQRLARPGGEIVLSTYDPDELAGLLQATGFTPELMRVRPPRPGEYPADKLRITARR